MKTTHILLTLVFSLFAFILPAADDFWWGDDDDDWGFGENVAVTKKLTPEEEREKLKARIAGEDFRPEENPYILSDAIRLKLGLETVKHLVSLGAAVNPDYVPSDKSSPLYAAVWNPANLEIVKFLVSHGADVKERNTLRAAASVPANLEIIAFLLENGADINARNYYQSTPLHCAVFSKDSETIRFLLDRGADINLRDSLGFTPVNNAIMRHGPDMTIIKLLVEHGADLNIHGGSAPPPLTEAIRKGFSHDDLGYLLDHGADIDLLGPLHIAIRRDDHLETFRFLIARGADVNVPCWNQTPVATAAKAGNKEAFHYLIEHGADIHRKTLQQVTPLHIIAVHYAGDPYFIDYFLDHGLSLEARDQNGETPLFYAVKYCKTSKIDAVRLFLSRGADVNARGFKGNTPLHAAYRGDDPEIIQLLLDHGADETLRNDDDELPTEPQS